jgi:hypothetical protein
LNDVNSGHPEEAGRSYIALTDVLILVIGICFDGGLAAWKSRLFFFIKSLKDNF